MGFFENTVEKDLSLSFEMTRTVVPSSEESFP